MRKRKLIAIALVAVFCFVLTIPMPVEAGIPGVAPDILGASAFTEYFEPNEVPGLPSGEWLFRVGCLVETPDGEPFENLVVTAEPPGLPGETIELIHRGGGYFLNEPVPWEGYYQNLVEDEGEGVWRVTATDSDGDFSRFDTNDLDKPLLMPTAEDIQYSDSTVPSTISWDPVSFLVDGQPVNVLYRVRLYDSGGNFLYWSGYLSTPQFEVPSGLFGPTDSFNVRVETIHYESGTENRGNAFNLIVPGVAPGIVGASVFTDYYEPNAVPGMPSGEWLFRVGCRVATPDGEPFENLVVTAAPPGLPGETIELMHRGGGYFLNDPVSWEPYYQNLVEVLGEGVWTVTAIDSDGDSASLDSNDLDKPILMPTVSYILPSDFTNAPPIYWESIGFYVGGEYVEAMYRVRIYDADGNFLHWSDYLFDTYYKVPGGIMQLGMSYFIQLETIHYDFGIENRGSAFMEFTATSPHPKYDRGHSVVEVFNELGEPDGFAIAGTTVGEYGDYDYLLIRTDTDGNEMWRRTYDPGDYSTNVAYDMVQCSDGGFALVGQGKTGYSDALLIRTNSDGDLLWSSPIDNNGRNDIGYALIELSDGGFAIAASTSDGYGSGGNWDGWLIITDSMGVIDEDKSQAFGDEDIEFAFDIIACPNGGFALTGYVYGAATHVSDMWLLRVYEDGSWWDKTYGDVNPDYGFSLIMTDDGGFAIGGMTYGYETTSYDAWVVKTDAMGVYQWSETYGGVGTEYPATIVKCEGGGYALGTSTYNLDTNSYDFWLLQFSSDWNVIESETFGGAGYDYFWSMIQTDSRGFAMVGWTGMGESEVLLVLVPPPLTPQEATGVIISEVEDLIDSGVLREGIGNALKAKLERAIEQLDRGHPDVAIRQLNAFIRQVNALVRSGNLSMEEGQRLIALAQEVIDMIDGT